MSSSAPPPLADRACVRIAASDSLDDAVDILAAIRLAGQRKYLSCGLPDEHSFQQLRTAILHVYAWFCACSFATGGCIPPLGARPQRQESGARRFLPSQRQEILRAFDGLGNFAKEFLQIFIAVDKIDF
jgi:hypothetical protein